MAGVQCCPVLQTDLLYIPYDLIVTQQVSSICIKSATTSTGVGLLGRSSSGIGAYVYNPRVYDTN